MNLIAHTALLEMPRPVLCAQNVHKATGTIPKRDFQYLAERRLTTA